MRIGFKAFDENPSQTNFIVQPKQSHPPITTRASLTVQSTFMAVDKTLMPFHHNLITKIHYFSSSMVSAGLSGGSAFRQCSCPVPLLSNSKDQGYHSRERAPSSSSSQIEKMRGN